MTDARALDTGLSPKMVFLPFAVLFALAAAPVLYVTVPPLADYPNHLARMYILINLETSALLQRYYEIVLSAQPNLAMDLIVPVLARVMPLEAAGKTFIVLTLLSLAGGTLALHRAIFRRWSLWPLLAFPFLYNRMFLWGFVGYLFSLGVALSGIAAWVALRDRPAWQRLAAGSAFAVALYLGHLYAFGVYALVLGGIELVRLIEARRGRGRYGFAEAAVLGAPFLLPVYLFVFVSPTSGAVGATYWGDLSRKVSAPFNVVNAYNLPLDALTLLAVAGLVLAGLVTRRVVVAWVMSGALALMLLAFLAMPDKLLSSYGADQRLPIAIALLAVASTDGRLRSAVWRRGLALALAALFVVRMGVIGAHWDQADRVYAGYRQAIERLPEGSRLMVVIPAPGRVSLPPIPVFEIANYAIIEKQAFVPILFAYPLHAAETVSFTPEYQALAAETPRSIVRQPTLDRLADPDYARTHGPFRPELLSRYDYVLVAHEQVLPQPVPPELETVYAGADFRLLRVPSSRPRPAFPAAGSAHPAS